MLIMEFFLINLKYITKIDKGNFYIRKTIEINEIIF